MMGHYLAKIRYGELRPMPENDELKLQNFAYKFGVLDRSFSPLGDENANGCAHFAISGRYAFFCASGRKKLHKNNPGMICIY